MSKTNTLVIHTPEGIVFSQALAGPVTRCLALIVDLCVVLGVMFALGMVLPLLGLISPGTAQAIQVILYFALSFAYWMTLEWRWRGQTLGKRVLRLRVVDVDGLRLQFSQVALRNLLRFVDLLPGFYLVGGAACVLSRRAQRLGDFAANTVVVRVPKRAEPDVDQLLAGKFNSLRAYPHLEARLRQRVSASEASLVLRALARRDGLDPVARVELFSELAAHFRAKVEFPAEATADITDEQYLRNVVDVLYRTRAARDAQVPPQIEPVAHAVEP